MYPSFLFCPLLGMTLTCVPALLSKRTLTKRVEEADSTDEKRKLFSINLWVMLSGALMECAPDYNIHNFILG